MDTLMQYVSDWLCITYVCIGNFGLVNQGPCLPSAVADVDHQQQLSNKNEGHTDRNTEQESQNATTAEEVSQNGKVIPEERVIPQCKPPGIDKGVYALFNSCCMLLKGGEHGNIF